MFSEECIPFLSSLFPVCEGVLFSLSLRMNCYDFIWSIVIAITVTSVINITAGNVFLQPLAHTTLIYLIR